MSEIDDTAQYVIRAARRVVDHWETCGPEGDYRTLIPSLARFLAWHDEVAPQATPRVEEPPAEEKTP